MPPTRMRLRALRSRRDGQRGPRLADRVGPEAVDSHDAAPGGALNGAWASAVCSRSRSVIPGGRSSVDDAGLVPRLKRVDTLDERLHDSEHDDELLGGFAGGPAVSFVEFGHSGLTRCD
jgi:hypothetical protein